MGKIRNSIKAIIIEDDKILMTKNKDSEGIYYLLPGGGQEYKETFIDTLKRELLEEIGATVAIYDLVFIREYIGSNNKIQCDMHQVEYMFLCKLISRPNNNGSLFDDSQIGFEWLPIELLDGYRFYPKELTKFIKAFNNKEKTPIYLGAIN